MGDYRKLWILLREQLTKQENETDKYTDEREYVHNTLTRMAEMEAAEFLED
ncbi:trigger factor [Hungatella sp.]|uniref:trigger factor n=1 Tax=Hungatella sp. TaxID=2613924 RepID=UPI002A81647A|nr:trigger factor [Hungatella sp.]